MRRLRRRAACRPTSAKCGQKWGTASLRWPTQLALQSCGLSRSTAPLKPREGFHPSKPTAGLPGTPGLNGPPAMKSEKCEIEGAPHLPAFGRCGNDGFCENERLALRLGLRYARGLREEA